MEKCFLLCALVLILFLDYTTAIKCYRCTIVPSMEYMNKTQRYCKNFEETDDFVVDCPFSTMCMKRVLRLNLLNKVTETVIRNCASQTYEYLEYKNNGYEKAQRVEEPYSEECVKHNDGVTFCHCRGALCNASSKIELTSYHIDAVAVIVAYNFLKYFKQIEY